MLSDEGSINVIIVALIATFSIFVLVIFIFIIRYLVSELLEPLLLTLAP